MKISRQVFNQLVKDSNIETVLKDRLEEALDKLLSIKVETEEFPQKNQIYWFLDSCGVCLTAKWTNHPSDRYRQSLGNAHRTEADAEHYKATTLRRWQAEIAIRRWRDEHCPFTPDWTNGHQGKFYGHFNHQTKIWMTTWTKQLQESGTIYFEIADDLRACIDALPDEWNALLID
jgi:hypothetical protein